MTDFRDGFEKLEQDINGIRAALVDQGQPASPTTPVSALAGMVRAIEGGTEPVYVHFAYSAQEPTSNEEIRLEWTADCFWLGVHSGKAPFPPEEYEAYHWALFRGADGAGLKVLGLYANLAALQAAHPAGEPGDAWLVGDAEDNRLYFWGRETGAWVDAGPLRGAPGKDGGKGDKGDKGDSIVGPGVPSGGTAGQIPIKQSADDYDVGWGQDIPGNAATATQLKSTRMIDGINFNGTLTVKRSAVCTTEGSAATKTAAITSFSLQNGAIVCITFSNDNTAPNPMLSISGTAAKGIYLNGAVAPADVIKADQPLLFIYDGTVWHIIGGVAAGGGSEGGGGSAPLSISATLSTSGWYDGRNFYIMDEALIGRENGHLRLAQTATKEQYLAYGAAMLQVIGQGTTMLGDENGMSEVGELTIRINGTVPTIAIPVEVLLV